MSLSTSVRPTVPTTENPTDNAPEPTLARRVGLSWVSWLRFAGITGVVLIHTSGLSSAEPPPRTTVGYLAVALDFASRWAVPVFVMLSGALLLEPARYRGGRDFIRKRAVRLLPPIIAWHLIYLGYKIATEGTMAPTEALGLILKGKLWTALYFFWIVLGLALITPVLVPWIKDTGRRVVGVVGLGASIMPALSLLSSPVRHEDAFIETPWTWWVPYVGLYLLGWVLRDVVLRSWQVVLAVLVAAGGSALLAWQWASSHGVGSTLDHWMPAESYYSPLVLAVSVAVFLTARALIRPGGLLRAATTPRASRLGRRLGGATMGVFAVHLLVLEAVHQIPGLPQDVNHDTVGTLLARALLTLVGAYVIAIHGAKVPYLRRIL